MERSTYSGARLGPPGATDGTRVRLTVERAGHDIDFELERAKIAKHSVKGWKRLGAKEDEWDWFIDPENKIGYVRMTQFSEDTTAQLDRALNQMRTAGLNALILDMTFSWFLGTGDPGGRAGRAYAFVLIRPLR